MELGSSQIEVQSPSKDLMQWVLQSKDIINSLRYFLEGVMPTIRNNEIKFLRVSEPLMNHEGISVTLMMMEAANKQSLMSQLDEVDIREIVGDFNDDYIDAMAVNTNRLNNKWGVKPDKRSLIVTTAINRLKMALLMAKDAGLRDAINKMEQVSRQIIDEPKKELSLFGRKM